MATELAAAYLTLMPTLRGSAKEISKQLGGIDVSSAGQKVGGGLGAAIGKTLKGGALVAAGAGVAAIGTAMVKGFQRLNAIDQATAKLKGLGKSLEEIDAIKDDALTSVQGTAFGFGDAAGLAGIMVTAGIKPGEQLQGVLKSVADSATQAGTDLGDMGQIWGKAAAKGKIDGEIVQQMMERQIPLLTYLGEYYGKNADEVQNMVSKGEVSFEDFAAAMEKNLGGAALASGDTFTGALANVGSALGRVGANFMDGFFPKLAPLFQSLTNAMGPLESAAGAIGEKVAAVLVPAIEFLTNLMSGEGSGGGIFEAWLAYAKPMADAWVQVGAALAPVVQGLLSQLGPIFEQLAPVLGQIGQLLGGVLVQAVTALAPLFTELVTMLLNLAGQVLPVLLPVLTALGQLLSSVFAAVLPVISSLFSALMPIIQVIADLLAAVLTPVLQALQPIFDALTPVLTFLAQLIGAVLVEAINVLSPILEWLAGVLGDVLGPAITALGDMLSGLIDFIVGVFTGDWEKAWEGITSFFTGLWEGLVGIVKGVVNGIIDLINGAIGGINDIAGAVGGAFGIDISIPSIPHLADGATVKPRRGGTVALLAEAGRAETVVDTGKMNALMDRVLSGSVGAQGNAGGPTVQVDVHAAPGMDEAAVGRISGNQAASQLRKAGF
ncbi:hypothetical protein D9V30_00060 [Mycetocola reblochoni]|uniref:Tape measure protein N-terminal domain-containing protein n=1 Tax=Mycetocola reblochoni TaxID=331618 RepID=A0A3L6ZSL3_9MICO|nr:tape measure protein [Mycetocola reblochoni]RLP70867.1 hypothetical protein D9V30_00060 [Mycetocola reblochoni]